MSTPYTPPLVGKERDTDPETGGPSSAEADKRAARGEDAGPDHREEAEVTSADADVLAAEGEDVDDA
jgi:hypothetical protein